MLLVHMWLQSDMLQIEKEFCSMSFSKLFLKRCGGYLLELLAGFNQGRVTVNKIMAVLVRSLTVKSTIRFSWQRNKLSRIHALFCDIHCTKNMLRLIYQLEIMLN